MAEVVSAKKESNWFEDLTGFNLPARDIAAYAGIVLSLLPLGACTKSNPNAQPIPVDGPQAAAVMQHSENVFVVDDANFPESITHFLQQNPHLRIMGITGEGNGTYGRDYQYMLITRPADPGEPPQRVYRMDDSEVPTALVNFKQSNPELEIVGITGNGNGTYGRDSFFVAIAQPKAE